MLFLFQKSLSYCIHIDFYLTGILLPLHTQIKNLDNLFINQKMLISRICQGGYSNNKFTCYKKMDTENKEQKSETQEILSESRPQGGIEGVPFPDFPDVESTQAATEPQPTEVEIHEEALSTPHDDFDWSIDKRNVTVYNNSEREKYDEVYDKTFKQINDGEMVSGTVVAMTKTDVVINIGFKSDGLVGLNEFRDTPDLKIGDEVEVMVAEKEDKDGNLHLSRKQARTTRAWERIVEMHKSGDIVTGSVTSKTKGGLIVDVFGMETFLTGIAN